MKFKYSYIVILFTFPYSHVAANDRTSSEQSVTILETIKVEAQKSSIAKTATGLDLSIKETPQSVTIISKAQLQQLGVADLADALKQTTGINVIQDSGRYRFQSRGFYIDQIEEDGMSSTVAGSASNIYRSASSSSDLDIYDHIEVLRGASGLTQANSEPGGTINAVRKHPTDEFQMQGYIKAGSWNNLGTMFDVSGPINQDQTLRGRFIAKVADSDSVKQDVSRDNRTLYGVMDYDLTASTLLRIGTLYQKSNQTPDYFGIPMAADRGDSQLNKNTYLGASWSNLEFEKVNVFGELAHQFNDDWKLSAKINTHFNKSLTKFASLAQLSKEYTGLSDAETTLKMNNMQYYDNDSQERAATIALNGQYHLLNATHDVFATFNYSKLHENTLWKRVLNSTVYDVYRFNPKMINPPNWEDYASTVYNMSEINTDIEQRAISLGTRFNFPEDFHLIVGGRYTDFKSSGSTDYQWWKYKIDSDGLVKNNPIKHHQFIPYFGLTYDITPNTSAYLSHTEIFKPQSSRNATGRVLDPVMGKNNEIGLKSELFNGRLNTALAIFQIEQENRAIYDSQSGFYRAEGKVRSHGFDLEISGYITKQLQLFSGYTYNQSKYLETESTSYEKGVNFSQHTPENMFRLYSQYHFSNLLDKLSFGLGVQAQTATSSLYNIKQGGYTLWNANLHYQVTPQLSLNFIGQNLTDKRYYENQRTRMLGGNNFLGTPQSFLMRLDWKY